jgi:hypothetical protein
VDVLSSRILLRPSDLDRSRRFYRDLLGLAIYREFGPPDDPGLVFFLGQGLLEVSGHAADPPGSSVMIWILWGANTPSRWLTCDVLSQPTLPCRTRARYHREPKALPKGTRRSIAVHEQPMRGLCRCGADATVVTDRIRRSSGSRAPVPDDY